MRSGIWIFVTILVLGISWVLLRWFGPHSIEVVHPVRGVAVQAVYATGTVEGTVMIPIATRGAARLVELNVDEGADVIKGQQLARLEDEDFQNSLKQLQAKESFAKSDFERSDMAFKRGAISKENYDRAKADLDAAKAATLTAAAQANFMKLSAPDDGHIVRRDGEIGQLIPANQAVFWFLGQEPLRISTEVDEEDISQVKPDQNVVIRADAFPGKIFHGKVTSVTPKGDPVSRSYRVRVEFTEPTPLQIGMTAETNIIIREKNDAILLPSSSLINGKVWRIIDSRLIESPVSVGANGREQVEIQNGVSLEDQVVLKPDASLRSGNRVHVILTEQIKP